MIMQMRSFTANNRLKKAALQVIARQISDEHIDGLRKIFMDLDVDGSGSLSVDEVDEALQRLDVSDDIRNDMTLLMCEMNQNSKEGQACINYTQFIASTIDKQHFLEEEVCKAAFHLFDIDADGVISKNDLMVLIANEEYKAMVDEGSGISDLAGIDLGEINAIMDEADDNGDGGISFVEFMGMMQQKEPAEQRKTRVLNRRKLSGASTASLDDGISSEPIKQREEKRGRANSGLAASGATSGTSPKALRKPVGKTSSERAMRPPDEGGPADSDTEITGPNPLMPLLSAKKIDLVAVRSAINSNPQCVEQSLDAQEGVPEPLFFAIASKSLELVTLLVEAKADVTSRYDGPEPWKGIKAGQSSTEAVKDEKERLKGSTLFQRMEDIEMVLKGEVDRKRGWSTGRRVSQQLTKTDLSKFLEDGVPEKAAGEAYVGDIIDDNVMVAEEAKKTNVEEALEVMRKKTLYNAAAAVVCEHIEGIPSERYEYTDSIGEGTYGTVIKVVDNMTGLKRAMKTVPKVLLEGSGFWQEIELMRELDHPNIMRLFSTYEDGENLYMMIEYCGGGELFDAIEREGHFTERTSATMIKDILGAICYLHNQKICHRDLKPENFLLETACHIEQAQIKLIDFGTARPFGEGQTEMTTKICTLHYVAPEILSTKRGSYTYRCDIWSIGVLLYVMLCGQTPFGGKTDTEVLKKVKKGKFKFEPEVLWSEISDDATQLINRLLVVDPNVRTSSEEALTHPWILRTATMAVNRGPNFAGRLLAFRKLTHFKRLALQVVAQQLSHQTEEIASLRGEWITLDSEQRGKLLSKDLRRNLAEDVSLSEEERGRRSELVDAMGEFEGVNYTQFIAAMLPRAELLNEKACRGAFSLFDLDGDGLITLKELGLVLQSDSSCTATTFEEVTDDIRRVKVARVASFPPELAGQEDLGSGLALATDCISLEEFVFMLEMEG